MSIPQQELHIKIYNLATGNVLHCKLVDLFTKRQPGMLSIFNMVCEEQVSLFSKAPLLSTWGVMSPYTNDHSMNAFV